MKAYRLAALAAALLACGASASAGEVSATDGGTTGRDGDRPTHCVEDDSGRQVPARHRGSRARRDGGRASDDRRPACRVGVLLMGDPCGGKARLPLQ
ncbi:hypothetical protein [Stakelama tenebrarum]|uniref:Uncharacterized protein n=1 Tax=Stakelama tenebrarum TaxID=2711215 RepID=A0A6G6Y980_9SPHN|nr:hypothetical protein [Sphingosinithalassobacter tenebrarum]QIG81401.1 hypothetical protein G5C33_17470 [Sphingosinithalassobacter tenebrarum]